MRERHPAFHGRPHQQVIGAVQQWLQTVLDLERAMVSVTDGDEHAATR